MNQIPIDFNYQDGLNRYPLQDYIDEVITNDITTSNIYMNNGSILNDTLYYSNSDLIIQNKNNIKNIYFKTSFNYVDNTNYYGTMIDFTGKLYVYHNYNVFQPTFSSGYYDVEGEILALKNDGISTDTQLTLLESGALFLQDEITTLKGAAINTNGAVEELAKSLYGNETTAGIGNVVRSTSFIQQQNRVIDLIGGMRRLAFDKYYWNSVKGATGAIAWGLAGATLSTIGSYLYYNYASNAVFNSNTSNSSITDTQRRTIYETNISNYEIESYSNFNVSMSNLNMVNGFINSNITLQQTISNLKTISLTIGNTNISNIYVAQNGGNMYDSLIFQKSTSGNPTAGYFEGVGARVIYNPSTTTTDYACSIGINNTTKKFWFSVSSNYAYEYWFGGDNTLIISSNIMSYNNGIINCTTLQQNSQNITDISSNIVLTQTPNVSKKYMFTATCTSSILMPDNITYYAYDIDLRNYTQTKTAPNPSTPYRIFKIKIFFGSVYFEVLTNGKPNVLSYEVYMSNESQASGQGASGINICAIGYPENTILNAISPTQLSLVRTGDFNFLSVLSRVNGTVFNGVIEDVLF